MTEKTTVVQVRVSEKLKKELDDICNKLGKKQPSVQVRELIEQFVKDHYGSLEDRLIIHIYRPEGYDNGAWRIAMSLRDPAESYWMGASIPFRLPQLAKRRISSDKGFEAVIGVPHDTDFVNYELGGVFIDGKWFGHIYSNGCPEKDNPTTIEEARIALYQSITELFDKFSNAKKPKD